MNQKEVWKDVKNYEGLYQVSNLGRVKSLKRKGCLADRILKPSLTSGYYAVGLSSNGKPVNMYVHQLVAEGFLNHTIGESRSVVVDHINNNPLDNNLGNLQVVSQRTNTSKDRSGGRSKYVGVSWNEKANKWRATIWVVSKRIHIGLYKKEIEASQAYQTKLKTL